LTPRRLKTIAAGQKPVNEAWIMFTPAKAASQSQFGLKMVARARLSRTTNPAKRITD